MADLSSGRVRRCARGEVRCPHMKSPTLRRDGMCTKVPSFEAFIFTAHILDNISHVTPRDRRRRNHHHIHCFTVVGCVTGILTMVCTRVHEMIIVWYEFDACGVYLDSCSWLMLVEILHSRALQSEWKTQQTASIYINNVEKHFELAGGWVEGGTSQSCQQVMAKTFIFASHSRLTASSTISLCRKYTRKACSRKAFPRRTQLHTRSYRL